jgi:hypothetical protein
MLKFFQTTQMKDVKLPGIAFCGSVALLALASATPTSAQGVPAGLLRLDPPTISSDYDNRVVDVYRPQTRSRNAFARDQQRRHPRVVRSPD